ncbi:glycoside hydrolase family 16 protein [Pseudonocardia kujensis]|uniref:glycoside hydrolase family 16 protein n=1 Tax=Pseudonocardia kujensis TaxID=1128675 RepID=UPI001E4A8D77|nr:glycoside hydrolase family 16 protein [Pseudonocardia kujensis]MCE0767469.1 glycoside hydrolase family 16 protein [Pseudonocardia kujensis]
MPPTDLPPTDLTAHLARLLATGVAALLGFVGPGAAASPADVPVVRTAAERPDSGGERVRRIPAPPRHPGLGPSRGTRDGAARAPAGAGGGSTGALPRSRTGATPTRTGDGRTAAAALGWGRPNREDDFTDGLDGWGLYDGEGHGGNGRRSPDALSIRGGVLVVTGSPDGTTGGMAWNPGQKYGRWEGRVRAPESDPSYHALLLLWPDAEDWPSGGEVDFMEMSDPDRRSTDMFLHYGADNSQLHGDVEVDATQWHNWAVEWTPDHIAAFVDGEEWWRTDDTGTLPPGPMHLTIQLDWFPHGGDVRESRMEVDWVRQYDL